MVCSRWFIITSVKGKGGFYVGKCEELRSRWEITCAHTHSYTHTHTPPHINTAYTHTYMHTPHINTTTLIYIHTHTHPHTHTHIYTLTHIHTVLHSHTHTMSLKSKSPKTQRVEDYFISPRLCVGTWSREKLPACAWLQEVMEHRGVRWVIHHWHLPHTTHRQNMTPTHRGAKHIAAR